MALRENCHEQYFLCNIMTFRLTSDLHPTCIRLASVLLNLLEGFQKHLPARTQLDQYSSNRILSDLTGQSHEATYMALYIAMR
jgi:hypothetical protein